MSAHRQSGFTLIEVIVALVLMALILAVLAGGMRVVSKGWDRGAEIGAEHEAIGTLHDFLRRETRRMQRIFWAESGETDDMVLAFTGERARMRYIVVEPPFPAEPGLYVVDLSVVHGRDGDRLVRKRIPFRSEMGAFDGLDFVDEVVLAEGAVRFSFRYRGAGEDSSWSRTWKEESALPHLIQVEAEGIGDDQPDWPVLVTHPRVEVESGCVPVPEGANAEEEPRRLCRSTGLASVDEGEESDEPVGGAQGGGER